MNPLRALLADLPEPDASARDAVANRAADILRPAGALARLDEIAVWLAGWQATSLPAVTRPAAVIFAGDHGVAADGVSAYPGEVTAAMLAAFHKGVATISAFAAGVGASVTAIDVGVGRPTGNLRHEPAMTPEWFAESVAAGEQAIDALDADILVVGEMGIGNTTAAAAVCACILGGDAEDWVGAGTGVDDDGRARKVAAVADAQRRVAGEQDPLELLRHVGGSELVAMAAAIATARQRRIPVVLDGFVVGAAALALHAARPGALDHCVAGHVSAEPGHRRLLAHLAMSPLLDLGMRLGEGSGAMLAVPLVAQAARGVTDVATFTEWFGAPPA